MNTLNYMSGSLKFMTKKQVAKAYYNLLKEANENPKMAKILKLPKQTIEYRYIRKRNKMIIKG